eukprot:scaffold46782_cov44-Prasinocladus_malaysianus.AAC.1
MRFRGGPFSSVRETGAALSGERGIIGIGHSSASPYTDQSQYFNFGDDSEHPILDFFGSNEGLIVRREASPAGSSGSASEVEDSDSEHADDNAHTDVQLRGVELHLEDAKNSLRQRQQEHRISHQAEYILQLEDDNLALRGRLLKMEEEIEKLRRKEDDHLNLQERFYLLQEELKHCHSKSGDEDLPTPTGAANVSPRVWDD